jgi:2'-hydroxyisoflavone reductase
MRLLILGGSGFAGRAVAEEAVRRGHEVTVFNRGHRDGPAAVRTLTGDRDFRSGLGALATGWWDAVLDTWSGDAEAVQRSADLLRGRAGHYTYVSTRSVYDWQGDVGVLTEETPLTTPAEYGYAGDKLRGEIAASSFDGPVLLARAGLILGPGEDVGRLPWWLNRLARGGPTLAPGPADYPLQYIDVRDLAAFLVSGFEDGRSGPYNVVGPSGHTTMGELLALGNEVTGGRAELVWVSAAQIEAAGIKPWEELPIWLPPGPDADYLHRGDVSKALSAGLRVRPVRETVADTWAWLRSLPGPAPQRPDRRPVGVAAEAEARVLALASPRLASPR